MKRENVNVLICSGGKRADIIKEFKNVLGDRGKVLITDAGELNAGRTFADGFLKSPRLQNEAYLPFLKKAVQKNKIKLVFSVIDPELLLLAEYQKELEELGARVLISPLSSVKITSDKRKTAEFLKKIGILTPAVFTLPDVKNFPVFIKPYDGSGSKFVYKACNAEELAVFAGIAPNPMVMEYIEGQEYTIDCLSDLDGNVINVIPRKRLEVNNGISVKSEVDLDRKIVDDSIKILEALRARGPATIQLIKAAGGKNYFTELNLRFGGGAMLGIRSGGNFAEKIIKMLGGENLEFSNDSVKNGYKMAAYLGHVFYE
ncbi:MAG: ATP-grasp domain-containing protein [Patescibacteria group bacterium]